MPLESFINIASLVLPAATIALVLWLHRLDMRDTKNTSPFGELR